ncbi:MAG TPA: proton-translocating transhydrogenase family protein [Beijerinckiaceae bacterium]|nr:proton-translocating transhydrogenase family protein [Beijerinckiaceae bacterium]
MANSPAELVEQARQAAAAAKAASDKAQAALDMLQGAADAAGAAASAATGGAVDPFIFRFAVFVMAIFVGYYVVWSVTPALHTPLMSVTNAISSVIIVGALLATGVQISESGSGWAVVFGVIALIFACVNIFGGFLVTQRMLAMYKKKG